MTQETNTVLADLKAMQALFKKLKSYFRKTYQPVVNSALNTAIKDAQKGEQQ